MPEALDIKALFQPQVGSKTEVDLQTGKVDIEMFERPQTERLQFILTEQGLKSDFSRIERVYPSWVSPLDTSYDSRHTLKVIRHPIMQFDQFIRSITDPLLSQVQSSGLR